MSGNKLYVGNLPFSMTDEDLARVFGDIGAVTSASIVTDRDTGRSRGFGFVEMANENDANQAIEKLNGQAVSGRTLQVNIARPREDRGGGGGRGGFGGGGGRGGRGGGGGGGYGGGGGGGGRDNRW